MQIYEYVKDLTFCRESKGHMFKARYHDTFIILTRHLTPPLPSLPLLNIFLPPPHIIHIPYTSLLYLAIHTYKNKIK